MLAPWRGAPRRYDQGSAGDGLIARLPPRPAARRSRRSRLLAGRLRNGRLRAAAAVGVPRRTLNQAVREGKLPARRVADVWLVRLPDVRAWLRGARHRPGPRPRPGQGIGRPRVPAPPADAEERAT